MIIALSWVFIKNHYNLEWLKFFKCLLSRCTSYVEMSVLFIIPLSGYFLNELLIFYFAYTRYKLSLRCVDTKKNSHIL